VKQHDPGKPPVAVTDPAGSPSPRPPRQKNVCQSLGNQLRGDGANSASNRPHLQKSTEKKGSRTQSRECGRGWSGKGPGHSCPEGPRPFISARNRRESDTLLENTSDQPRGLSPVGMRPPARAARGAVPWSADPLLEIGGKATRLGLLGTAEECIFSGRRNDPEDCYPFGKATG